MIDNAELGRRLKKLRGKKTSQTASREIGIKHSSLRNYENGLRRPKDDIKQKIAKYYGITVEELFYT